MLAKKNILFIINPISGISKKENLPELIEKHLDGDKFNFELKYTEYAGHSKKITQEFHTKFDAIIAVGGDGSVNEIGSHLVHTACVFGIIPAGSGNGYARHHQIPLSPVNAIKNINQWNVLSVDTGKINQYIFLGTAGIGFDAHIAEKFDQFGKRGFKSYFKLVLQEYRKFHPFQLKIKTKHNQFERRILMATIANTNQYGNNFIISPDSISNDGFFELILIEKFPMIKAINLGFRFFSKRINKSKYYEVVRFDNTLELFTDFTQAHVDGEPIQLTGNLSFSVVPKSLNLLVPKK